MKFLFSNTMPAILKKNILSNNKVFQFAPCYPTVLPMDIYVHISASR